jgi:hypothetical protein
MATEGVSMTGRHILLVYSNPVEGREDEYNDWYDRVHLSETLKVPGIDTARRYTLVNPGSTQPGTATHKYLAIYELTGDPEEVMTEMSRRLGTGEITLSETLDLTTVQMTTW